MIVDRRAALAVLGVLGAIVLAAAPSVGAEPQLFRTPVRADGLLAPLVRAADGEWKLGLVRAPVLLAGLLVALATATEAAADCTCRALGRSFELGQSLCLTTPNGPRVAVCDLMVNVTSWRFSQTPCVTAGVVYPRAQYPRVAGGRH